MGVGFKLIKIPDGTRAKSIKFPNGYWIWNWLDWKVNLSEENWTLKFEWVSNASDSKKEKSFELLQ